MYVIEVIPLAVLPPNVPQILSYFFDRRLEKGAIVQISLNNRKVNAIVVSYAALESQKILLKKTGFQLKKLSSVVNEIPQVSAGQFQTALWLSKYYYAPLGLCLKTVLPPFFLKKKYELKTAAETVLPPQKSPGKPLIILSGAKDTLDNLMPHIKKSILNDGLASPARGQVLFIVPEKINLEYLSAQLSDKYKTVVIHSGLSNKQYFESWVNASGGTAQIIIGTRQALFLSFKNLRLIIVDDPLNDAYKSDMSPRYNTPELAKHIAAAHGSKIIFTSSVIGIQNYNLIKNNKLAMNDTKTKNGVKLLIVNATEELKENNFSPLSRKLKEILVSRVKLANQKILIFSPRRGYSGIAVCQNCGLAVKCPDCAVAMRVHKTTDFILICHRCSRNQPIPQFCANCNSYKIKTAGQAGSQKIYDEIQRTFERNNISGIPVLILDSDIAKNETEEEEALEEIKKPRTSVLVATQMIFSRRYQLNFNLIGIINADALVNSPDYKTDEEFIYQMEKLKDFEPSEILIQTHNPEDAIFQTLQDAKYDKFYNNELQARQTFSYPPFSRLIKLSFKHKNQAKASFEARLLTEKLKRAAVQMKLEKTAKIIDASPASVERERGLYIFNIILKISPEFENIRELLKFVPAGWIIDADPKAII